MAQYELEEQGNLVVGCTFLPKSIDKESERAQNKWELFDEIHKRKIDMSDAVFVVNVGGYIGESTRNEIEYAKAHGKEIIYLKKIRG